MLRYPLTTCVLDGCRRTMLSMTGIQFAAGAQQLLPLHEIAQRYTSSDEVPDTVEKISVEPLFLTLVSPHVMRGCGIAAAEGDGVTRPNSVSW